MSSEDSDSEGMNPLHMAALLHDLPLLRNLLKGKKYDVDAVNEYGETVLHLLAVNGEFSNSFYVSEKDAFQILELLARKGSDINRKDDEGNTVLHLAVRHRHYRTVRLLLKLGCDPNQVNEEQFTILHELVKDDCESKEIISLINFLLQKGARVDITCPNGNTALILAAKNNNWRIVKTLLDNKALSQSAPSERISLIIMLAEGDRWWSRMRRHIYNIVAATCTVDRQTVMGLAVKANNWGMVKFFLLNGGDVNYTDVEQSTIFHRLACDEKETCKQRYALLLSLVDIIIKKGANVHARDSLRNTPVQLAAKHGHWRIIEKLLAFTPDVNELDSDGFAILHRLAQTEDLQRADSNNIIELINTLIHKGANIDLQSLDGETALLIAAKNGSWEIAEELMKNGARANVLDSEQVSVLHIAAMDRTPYVSDILAKTFISLCTRNGANLNAKDEHGQTPLHMALNNHTWILARELIIAGANPNLVSDDGYCALHILAKNTSYGDNMLQIMTFLLDHGAHHDTLCPNGDHIVHLAAQNDRWEMVKELITRGADPNIPDSEGLNVLQRLAMCKSSLSDQEPLLQMLLEKNAQFNNQCCGEESIINLAAQSDNWALVEWLLTRKLATPSLDGEGRTLLHHLVASGFVFRSNLNFKPLCDLILDIGVDINTLDKTGNSALYVAAKKDRWDIFKYLLEKGARTHSHPEGQLPILHMTIGENPWIIQRDTSGEILDLILNGGTRIDETDNDGNTPLHLTARMQHWDWAAHLIRRGAKSDIPDNEGYLPLHRMCLTDRHYDEAKVLGICESMSHETNTFNIEDRQGHTAIQLAAKHNLWKVLEHLLPYVRDVNAVDGDGYTLLHRVSSECYDEGVSKTIISSLLEQHADINMGCMTGDTALQLAACNHKWHNVEHLLRAGSIVDMEDSEHYSLLHRLALSHSSIANKSDILQTLISTGIDLNLRDPKGNTAMNLAATQYKWRMAVSLIQSGARVETFLENGETLLHLLAKHQSLIDRGELTLIVELLMKNNVEINAQNSQGKTALHVAYKNISDVKWTLVKTLVQHGADPTICDNDGDSVFHMICADTQNTFQHGADPTIYDNDGDSLFPLICGDTQNAYQYKFVVLEVLNMFVDRGVDIDVKGRNGHTALQVALQCENWPVFGILIDLGANYTLANSRNLLILRNVQYFLPESADQQKQDAFIKYLIKCKGRRKARRNKQVTMVRALFNCVSMKHWGMVQILIRCCGDNLSFLSDEQSIVHCLVGAYQKENHAQWITFLDTFLSLPRADMNFRDIFGRTALHRAIEMTNENPAMSDIVRVLIQRGADPLVADTYNHTPLILILNLWKSKSQRLHMLKYFIELGAIPQQPRVTDTSPTEGDSECEFSSFTTQLHSPTELMVRLRNSCLVKILIESGASSNLELWHLLERFEIQLSEEAEKLSSSEKLLQILRKAAGCPRSLKSLCRLAISRMIKCGVHYQKNVKSLPVPAPLQDYLMFSDVLKMEED